MLFSPTPNVPRLGERAYLLKEEKREERDLQGERKRGPRKE